jgi:DNA topoisomerase-1
MHTIMVNKQPLICFGTPRGQFNCKFNRIAKLAVMYDELERKLDSFINTGKITERSTCALAVKIMLHSGIRIGNNESAAGFFSKIKKDIAETYGLTTLKKEHVKFKRDKVVLEFVGKKHVEQRIEIKDKVIVHYLKRLYKHSTPDKVFPISDYMVRKFVSISVGRGFVPKDFRTFYANLLATQKHLEIIKRDKPRNKSAAKKEVKEIITFVAEQLGNTPAITKRSYLDVRMLDFHLEKRYA